MLPYQIDVGRPTTRHLSTVFHLFVRKYYFPASSRVYSNFLFFEDNILNPLTYMYCTKVFFPLFM